MHLEIGPGAFVQDCKSYQPSEWLVLFWPNMIHPLANGLTHYRSHIGLCWSC